MLEKRAASDLERNKGEASVNERRIEREKERERERGRE